MRKAGALVLPRLPPPTSSLPCIFAINTSGMALQVSSNHKALNMKLSEAWEKSLAPKSRHLEASLTAFDPRG